MIKEIKIKEIETAARNAARAAGKGTDYKPFLAAAAAAAGVTSEMAAELVAAADAALSAMYLAAKANVPDGVRGEFTEAAEAAYAKAATQAKAAAASIGMPPFLTPPDAAASMYSGLLASYRARRAAEAAAAAGFAGMSRDAIWRLRRMLTVVAETTTSHA
jgi:hypothetical protein